VSKMPKALSIAHRATSWKPVIGGVLEGKAGIFEPIPSALCLLGELVGGGDARIPSNHAHESQHPSPLFCCSKGFPPPSLVENAQASAFPATCCGLASEL